MGSRSAKPRRVLVIGADGADPTLLRRLMSAHKLPNLASLCEQGSWGPLRTTFPPVSPVAWTTCLTGVPAASHGIRDFVTKAPNSYLPTIGLYEVRSGEGGIPSYKSRRRIPTIAKAASAAGRTVYVLKVPGTFPPEPCRGGMLAGFGMPDLLGTFGVSLWFTTAPKRKIAQAPEGADLVHPLTPLPGGGWRGSLAGPGGTKQELVVRRRGGEVRLYLGRAAQQPCAVLGPGTWSNWVRIGYDLPGRGRVEGMCRFKLVSLGPETEIYATAVQCTPDAPLYSLAEPAGFARRIEELVGPYATLGMPSDMDGVRRGVVDLDTFLEDAYANWEQQVEMTLRLMDAGGEGGAAWDLIVTHLFTVDNVQHLFWHCQDPSHPGFSPEVLARYGGEIERAYRWLDQQVGRLIQHAPPDTAVLVVSDHGGAPVYRFVYLNAWLRDHGYLAPRENVPEGKAARLDWDRTRAAMYGTGAIWLNVQGRDPRGIVPAGAAYGALRHEIASALTSWRDPETGQPVIKRVLAGSEVFGDQPDGPDLVVALERGYGLGRGEGLGRVANTREWVIPNRSPWSGGHEGPYLPADIPGVYVLGRCGSPSGVPQPGLADVAATVLRLLQVDAPPWMSGRSLI